MENKELKQIESERVNEIIDQTMSYDFEFQPSLNIPDLNFELDF